MMTMMMAYIFLLEPLLVLHCVVTKPPHKFHVDSIKRFLLLVFSLLLLQQQENAIAFREQATKKVEES